MGQFKIIVPEETTNLVWNPSAEATGSYSAYSGGSISRTHADGWRGVWSYAVSSTANGQGASFTCDTLTGATHYLQMMVSGTLPSSWQWSLNGVDWQSPVFQWNDSGWSLYGQSFIAAQVSGSAVYIKQNGAGSGSYYVDAIQLEAKDHMTTYIDGDHDIVYQNGIPLTYWRGRANGSSTFRALHNRKGGRVYDLEDDYYFHVNSWSGLGVAPIDYIDTQHPALLGNIVQNAKNMSRVVMVNGFFDELHVRDQIQARASLYDAVKPNLSNPVQPFVMQYYGGSTGTAVSMELYYESGLQGKYASNEYEMIGMRFIGLSDPWMYSLKEDSYFFSSNASDLDMYGLAAKINGEWRDCAGGVRSTGTTTSLVYDMDWDIDNNIVVIGRFHTAGGQKSAGIARYYPITDTWEPLATSTTGTSPFGQFECVKCHPNGDIFVGGTFWAIDGVPANHIAYYRNNTWHALGNGVGTGSASNPAVDAIVYSIDINQDGDVIVGGLFLFAGSVRANHIAKWDYANWSAFDTGVSYTVPGSDPYVDHVLVTHNNDIAIGGSFNSPASYYTRWNGTVWSTTNFSLINPRGLAEKANGDIIISYSTNVARLTGQTKTLLATNSRARSANSLHVGINDVLYSTGYNYGLILSGTTAWFLYDADKWKTFEAWSITAGFDDPYAKLKQAPNGDIAISANEFTKIHVDPLYTAAITAQDMTPSFSGVFTNEGSVGTCDVESLANQSISQTARFNYSLQPKEQLTINFTPGHRAANSTFFGDVTGRCFIPGSDINTIRLEAGANNLNVFMPQTTGASGTAAILYRKSYLAIEGTS